MRSLPEPGGPYLVGSCSHEMRDFGRATHVLDQNPGRELFIKLWYPADRFASETCTVERLWEQLRSEPDIPGFVRLLLRPAMNMATHSYRGAPYSADAGPPRILIYSHGMISFASENTSLMEHLASRGYTVVSLQHKAQLAELRALQRGQSEKEKQEQKALEREIRASADEQKAALWKRYYGIASNTNRIVAGRSADIGFIVEGMESLLAAVPGLDGASSAKVIGVIGLSLGGAVATEYAKGGGAGASCVVNMDGGIYGTLLDAPIDGQYLMLYSEQNSGTNEAALTVSGTGALSTKAIPGTKHLNFHDIAAIYPLMKWLGIIGPASPQDVIEMRNESVSDFVSKVQERARDSEPDHAATTGIG
ncbi:MAG: hypothetical protein JXB36_02125 [Gammaproteobacteria bacterium]|nr:hypothetical protein [Gammaproteobacteria bacterium]